MNNQGTSGQTASTSPGTSIPPVHWTKVSVSGGTAKLPERTLSAEADSPTSYGNTCAAHIDDYSVTVHATPCNFQRTNFSGVTPPSSVKVGQGILQFHYEWDSSANNSLADGTHPDLSAIEIHENVDTSSSSLPPPFFWSPPVHFDVVAVSADAGAIIDYHSWGGSKGVSLSNSFTRPYQANSFDLTQTYKFHDPAIMQPGVEEIIPGDSGPFTITDAVIADSTSPSGFSFQVTKDGQPSLPQPLP